MPPPLADRTLVLFNHDFDQLAHRKLLAAWPLLEAGFDLFAFPSQVRLAWFDIERFAALQAVRARVQGCRAVVSHHEQYGALAAALVAERMGWPGTPVQAVLACQHKLHARTVLARCCPEANIASVRWPAAAQAGSFAPAVSPVLPKADQGAADLRFPVFAKPIKAAFSVLAREIADPQQLQRLVGFKLWESTLLRLLVKPFDRVVRKRLPEAGSAFGMMLEEPIHAAQFNLDGYVFEGELRRLGVVDAQMYPGTQAFMRFDYPTRLRPSVVARATEVARRFLQAVGFTHGLFNMEFFYDELTDRLSVIEFNPRMASQFSDLYERVDGVNLHEVGLALAHGRDPAQLPRRAPTASVASSFVYRSFNARRAMHRPTAEQRALLHTAYPDALLIEYPRTDAGRARDHKWLGSCRHGILHLGGHDELDLRRRCEVASRLLGWTPPYSDLFAPRAVAADHQSVGPVEAESPAASERSLNP